MGTEQVYYLDSDHIIAYIHSGVHRNADLGAAFRGFLNKKGTKKSIKFVLPQVAAGEVINYITNEAKVDKTEQEELIKELVYQIQKLKIDLKPAKKEDIRVAKWLLEKEEFTSTTDAVILSQALCDPDSKYLLTTDKVLTGSTLIGNICGGEEIDKLSKKFKEEFDFIDRKNSKLKIKPVTDL